MKNIKIILKALFFCFYSVCFAKLPTNVSKEKEQINLNSLSKEQVRKLNYQVKDFSITKGKIKHRNVFKNQELDYSILAGVNLEGTGIEQAKGLHFTDFTNAYNAPKGMVGGNNSWYARLAIKLRIHRGKTKTQDESRDLWHTKLAGQDLTHIGITQASSLKAADFTGAYNAPKGMARGRDLDLAILSGLDLSHIDIKAATNLSGAKFKDATNEPPGMAIGQNLSFASLYGLDLTKIEITKAKSLVGASFEGAHNSPVGMAIDLDLGFTRLSGLDLTLIEITKAKNLKNANFTNAYNAPKGMARERDFAGTTLAGLDLTWIEIDKALPNLQSANFTNASNAPKGMAQERDFAGTTLAGLDLTWIKIDKALPNLQRVNFTSTFNAPKKMARKKNLWGATLANMDLNWIALEKATNYDRILIGEGVKLNKPILLDEKQVLNWDFKDNKIEYKGKLLGKAAFLQLVRLWNKLSEKVTEKFISRVERRLLKKSNIKNLSDDSYLDKRIQKIISNDPNILTKTSLHSPTSCKR